LGRVSLRSVAVDFLATKIGKTREIFDSEWGYESEKSLQSCKVEKIATMGGGVIKA
jgi:hypothetical protein